MAEEVLVKEPLRGELLEAGRKLTRLLAQSDIQLKWSFWLYTSEANDWRLVLITPLVDSVGPKRVYSRIRTILSESSDPTLSLLNTTVQSAHNPYARAFEEANIRYDLEAANVEPRLSRQRVGDVFIEDAVLYRIPRAVS